MLGKNYKMIGSFVIFEARGIMTKCYCKTVHTNINLY